jgi:hypothetical protein
MAWGGFDLGLYSRTTTTRTIVDAAKSREKADTNQAQIAKFH